MDLLSPRSRVAGFTLVESLAVVGIIAILLAVGIPSMLLCEPPPVSRRK